MKGEVKGEGEGEEKFHFSPPPPHPLFPNQYGGEFQDDGEFTIASSKTPALQARLFWTFFPAG